VFPIQTDERKPFAAAAILLAAASVALLRLPLFNYLGYEFSASVALLLPLVSGVLALRALGRRWPRGTALTTAGFRSAVSDLLAQNLALLLVPFAAAVAAGIVVRNCAYGEGILWFLLLPAVTAVWLTALAAFCVVLFRRPAVWYAVVIAAALVHPILLGYWTPAAFSYNVLYGFFPGLTYDESLHLSWRLFLFRYLTLASAALFLLAAEFIVSYRKAGQGVAGIGAALRNLRFHPAGRLLMAVILVQLLAGWLCRIPLGFESTASSIADALGASVTTEHFEISYDPASIPPEEIGKVAQMHEFRYAEVRQALGVAAEPRVHSFLYPDAATKRRYTGAGNTDIAKPWLNEIHLGGESWDGTLKHELIHVLAGTFGMPVIRAHYNTGLVEGLATAVDGSFGNKSLPEYAAAMRHFGLLEHPEALLRFDGFALRSSTVSYVAMGAFCQYLIAQHGIERFRQVYGGGSPERVYGRPLKGLVDDWIVSLAAVPVDEAWRPHIDFYFRRPSIFAKLCARAVANTNEEGQRLLSARDPDGAARAFRAGLDLSWNTGSYAGLIRAASAAHRPDSVVALMRALKDDESFGAFAGLLLPYGDACWGSGDSAEARAAYARALELDISVPTSDAAALRLALLADSAMVARLPGILFASLADSAVADSLEGLAGRSAPMAILASRALLRTGAAGRVPALLGSISAPLEPRLEAMKHRLMASAYERLGAWEHAAAHYRIIAASAPGEAARAAADDDARRCAWLALHDERAEP
jgi:tetratricopeptide (TPR) repeat protein